ncbi:MAG: TaqI-like C-terminal specificity domain-containing protein [Candidatus Bathyarchaeia archaeon]|jgi:hypothetical protein
MVEYDDVLRGIKELIQKYSIRRFELGEKGLKEIGEANIRKDFVDKLFSVLGWKTDDSREYDSENYVRGVGHADVAIKVGAKPIIFVEAKKFGGVPSRLERGVQLTLAGQKIYADWTSEERQVLNYAGMSIDAKWAILTNFEKFRLFNSKTGETVLNIETPNGYLERIDDLMLLTREQVIEGNINKLESRVERPDVDLNFLNALNDWRLKLARNIHKNCPELKAEELQKYVQRILDRFVIIRYAEDKWVLKDPDQLHAAFEYWSKTRIYTSLTDIIRQLFIGFNQIHDSRIFEEDPELDKVLVKIDNEVLSEIIQALYGQNFRKFTSDILGNTYESYLGSQLFINKDVELRPTPALKKSSGVYYTEPAVVNYIVSNTLGAKTETLFKETVQLYEEEKIKESTDKFSEITKIRVLDPACGSGSFLIQAFKNIERMYKVYNETISAENQRLTKRIFNLRTEGKNKEAWQLEAMWHQPIEDFERKILLENISGVDIDISAAEIASVNLMLQALKRGEKLPLILQENIKVGNSIVGSDDIELEKFFGKQFSEIESFQWKKEFKNIIDGFDVVIGNPPYFTLATQSESLKRYFRESTEWSEVYRGQNDILFYFIIRGLSLLKEGGLLGFVVARYWLESLWADKLRGWILKNATIKLILDSGNVQFFKGANVLTCIIILEKESSPEARLQNNIKIIKVKKWGGSHDGLFQHIVANQGKDLFEDRHICIFNSTQGVLTSEAWSFSPPETERLKRKMRQDSWILGEDVCTIGQGMKTGLNKAFIVTPEIIDKYEIEKQVLKKYVKTRNIKRYHIDYRDLHLIYTVPETNPDSIPNTMKYLKQFRPELEERFQFKAGVCTWFGLSIPQNRKLFDNVSEKLLVPNYATSNKFAYDNESFYTLTDTYVLVPKMTNINPKYVLGILNSRLMNFFYKSTTKLKRDGYMEYVNRPLSEIPIKKLNLEHKSDKALHDEIVREVDELIELSRKRAAIILDFNRYIDDPIIDYVKFGSVYHELNPSEQEADKTTKGTITRVKVTEEDSYLRFSVDILVASNNEEIEVPDYTVVRCKIDNENLRRFILFYANSNWKSLGAGNLLSRMLGGKIPLFSKNQVQNLATLTRIATNYSEALEHAEKLESQIEKTDSRLNQRIYDLYGIDNDERKFIDSEMSQYLSKVDDEEDQTQENEHE